MSAAHSLWGQAGHPLLAEVACRAINAWVDDNTRHKFHRIISSDNVQPDTGLLLANAVDFKGMWEEPFEITATRQASFNLEDGGQVEVAPMHQEVEVRYAAGEGFQVVDLAYQGRDCLSIRTGRKVDIFLPKFKPLFRADHAFLFAIVDRHSDSLLFLGRMSDPSKES